MLIIATSSVVGGIFIIIIVTIIVIVILYLKKRRHEAEGKDKFWTTLISYIYMCSIGKEQDNRKGSLL